MSNFNYTELNHELDRVKSRVFRRKDAAFFGPLLCSLDFIWNENIETAQTNGEVFEWSPVDFQRCNDEEREATIMHELWHVARLHGIRCGTRCPDVWNTACDIKINRDLIADGFKIGAPLFVHIPQITEEVEEDIYDLLKQNGGGSSNQPQSKCSHGHLISNTPVNAQAMVNNVVKAVQAAKMAGQPGAIPGGVQQVVDRFLSPVIPWETHLKEWMTDLLEFDYTWARPNRRYTDMYLPSSFTDEGRLDHLVYFQDVSGSISDSDIVRFNSELKYVWDELKPAKMTVIQFDTIIQKIDEFREGDTFEKIIIIGRGGTSLVCVREKIIELEPTAAIIFSDMQVQPMRPLPIEVPILWVATNASGHSVPFGKIIHIKT